MKKIRRNLRLLLTAIMVINILTGCSAQSTGSSTITQDTAVQQESGAEISDIQTETDTVHPTAEEEPTDTDLLREDYYEYVNKKLLDATDIPSGEAQWSWFYELGEDAYNVLDETLNEILEDRGMYEKGSDEQMIADSYLTYLDTDTRNSAGLGPLQKYLDDIQDAADIQEYIEAVGRLNGVTGKGSIIYLGEAVDKLDSTRYMEQFYSMYLGLGKEILLDESFDDLISEYQDLITIFLTEAGYSEEDADIYAPEILSFMMEMAPYALDTAEIYSPEKTYNPYTVEELDALFTNFDVEAYLSAGGYDNWDYYIVTQEKLFRKVNEMLTEENLDLLKAYSSYCLVEDFCDVISMRADEAEMDFELKLFGLDASKDLERRAGEAAQSLFGFEFGKLYVDRCFSEDDKQAVTEMIERFIDHYRERIGELDWLSDSSKQAAIKKLDTMVIKVGYPDVWPEYYTGISITGPEDGGSLIENCFNLQCAVQSWWMELVKHPVDRTVWELTPQTVNAYYNYSLNEIVFPAAILQDPFYSPMAKETENYGGIGMIIAHEITHAFDADGSKYDDVGNYNPWWTEEDAENFAELTQTVIDYYDTIEINGRHVNGTQTVSENIADLGAMNTVTSFFEGDTEALDEVFHKYAATWASKSTDEYFDYLMNVDVHSPDSVRVNAVIKTLDCFYDTYPEIQEGDGMYLAPEDRVKIW